MITKNWKKKKKKKKKPWFKSELMNSFKKTNHGCLIVYFIFKGESKLRIYVLKRGDKSQDSYDLIFFFKNICFIRI